MPQETSKALEYFELTARPIEDADLPRLHELTVGVGWPHRPEDIRLLMDVGRGYVACDEIGRVIGSAMWFPVGERFATLGMVITSPRMQSRGAGRWLMERVLADAGDRVKFLNATAPGMRLYEQLGFRPLGAAEQRQGEAVAAAGEAPARGTLRPARPEDLQAICRLDQRASGLDRQVLLGPVLARSSGLLLERGGEPVGFALTRPFGRGQLLGPLVAEDDAAAIALAAPLIATQAGHFLRIDTAQTEGPFARFLDRSGLLPVDRLIQMQIGEHPATERSLPSYAFINQALN